MNSFPLVGLNLVVLNKIIKLIRLVLLFFIDGKILVYICDFVLWEENQMQLLLEYELMLASSIEQGKSRSKQSPIYRSLTHFMSISTIKIMKDTIWIPCYTFGTKRLNLVMLIKKSEHKQKYGMWWFYHHHYWLICMRFYSASIWIFCQGLPPQLCVTFNIYNIAWDSKRIRFKMKDYIIIPWFQLEIQWIAGIVSGLIANEMSH